MATIILTITASDTETISGIPDNVTITADITSIIFYTLDGTIPDLTSNVYTGPINLPTNNPSVTLKAFASNGTDISNIFSNVYSPNITSARVSHSKAVIVDPLLNPGCGTRGEPPKVLYSQPGDTPMNAADVLNVDQDGYGYAPNIYPMREYDLSIPLYVLRSSDSNWKGEMGKDIGTMPPSAKIIYNRPDPEESSVNKATYNPRALVTFHDGRLPNENEAILFRPYFEGEDLERSMYGTKYSTTADKDGDFAPNGSLLRYLYNPTENTITFYYRDNRNNRWIISKEPARPTSQNLQATNPLYNFISPAIGSGHVYKWMLFKGTFVV